MRVLRVLTGQLQPCGCLIGTYELYDGRVARIVDARAPDCPDADHRVDAVIALADKVSDLEGAA